MANRRFNQFTYALEKFPVNIFCTVDGNGTGVPTLLQSSPAGVLSAAPAGGFRGVKSVTRSGVGTYVITLQDNYVRLLGMDGAPYSRTGAAVTTWGFYISTMNLAASGGGTITIVTFGAAAGTPVEWSSTVDRWYFSICLSNTSAI